MSDGYRPAKPKESLHGIGERLRNERLRAGLSQRELARRLGLSASMISQIEGGSSKPSVGTLWAIVTELDVSLDRVIRGEDFVRVPPASPSDEPTAIPVVHPDERQVVELASGVRWEELAPTSEEDVDFVFATYEVGSASTEDGSLMRHHGREYGFIVAGTLGIQIEFRHYTLEPGDAIAFDSTRPHRLYNAGQIPVRAVWFVAGRGGDLSRGRSTYKGVGSMNH